MDSIKTANDYYNNERADHNIWNYGDFMEMGTSLPEEVILEVPYDNFEDNIGAIYDFVINKIKEMTSRDIKSVQIMEVK